MDETSNREKAEKAFRDLQDGTDSINDPSNELLADDVRRTAVGRSHESKTYDSKERFIGEALRPVAVRGLRRRRHRGRPVGRGRHQARREALREHVCVVHEVPRGSGGRGDGLL